MLIYPCAKCMYCCWDPTNQSNELGPIWYLQPKPGFWRNSFMSLRPWHVLLAWPASCGVISSNSPATMLSDIKFQSKLTKTSPTCKIKLLINRTFKLLRWNLETRNSPVPCPGHSRTAFPSTLPQPLRAPSPNDLSPASSNLPCFSKTTAKLLADSSVPGCWGPSWDSRPSKARRCSPSASRLEVEHWGGETWGTPAQAP